MNIRNPHCPPFISESPSEDLKLIVTIPCYNEPNLISSLKSLYDCDPIDGSTEVIVIINNSIDANKEIKQQNNKTYIEALEWSKEYNSPNKKFYIYYFPDLPKKHAGVGLARKIAMDEAARRFQQINHLSGIIQCYDADSLCKPNLLNAVLNGFKTHQPSSLGIHYEHPIEGTEFSEDVYNAIISYELHLRYYDSVQKFIDLPFAYQTIGSSMAVNAADYILQGGMNKRKAGEDFYFLQKFISLDRHIEIHDTMVIPSPRMSDRVPFGTGKAVNDIIENNRINKESTPYMSYNPQAFIDLYILIKDLRLLYNSTSIIEDSKHWPESLKSYFFKKEDLLIVVAENKKNTTNYTNFQKRFFKWFNAFRLMKFLHYCRDQKIILDLPIKDAAYIHITQLLKIDINKNEKEMLLFFRNKR